VHGGATIQSFESLFSLGGDCIKQGPPMSYFKLSNVLVL
jgi:hypothetical protein